MVGDVVKFFVRVIGWLSLDMVVYQGNSLISKRRKREDDVSENHFNADIDDEGDYLVVTECVTYLDQ
jgi:hypothetical protein